VAFLLVLVSFDTTPPYSAPGVGEGFFLDTHTTIVSPPSVSNPVWKAAAAAPMYESHAGPICALGRMVAQHAHAVPAVNSPFSSKHERQQLCRSRQQERQQEPRSRKQERQQERHQQERHPRVEEQVCRYSWHVRALELPVLRVSSG